MRLRVFTFLMLALVGSACSYEAKRKTETAVEQSVDKFHDQLKNQQYHEIYAEADPVLHSRIGEEEFTGQLIKAHAIVGDRPHKAIVIINDGFWRGVKRAFSSREKVDYGNLASNDLIIAHEGFTWAVENDLPRLVSYEVRPICNKPCTIGFGTR